MLVDRSCLTWVAWVLLLTGMAHTSDGKGAILHSQGQVLVNGHPPPEVDSIAIFPGDVIQTEKGGKARLVATGSDVEISSDAVLRFEDGELYLEHGALSILTFRKIRIHVGCVTVLPIDDVRTVYDVSDVDGMVSIAARKSDVMVETSSEKTRPASAKQSAPNAHNVVKEGQQESRPEHCKAGAPSASAGNGGLINSPYVKWPALGVTGGVICWILCGSGQPASPAIP